MSPVWSPCSSGARDEPRARLQELLVLMSAPGPRQEPLKLALQLHTNSPSLLLQQWMVLVQSLDCSFYQAVLQIPEWAIEAKGFRWIYRNKAFLKGLWSKAPFLRKTCVLSFSSYIRLHSAATCRVTSKSKWSRVSPEKSDTHTCFYHTFLVFSCSYFWNKPAVSSTSCKSVCSSGSATLIRMQGRCCVFRGLHFWL